MTSGDQIFELDCTPSVVREALCCQTTSGRWSAAAIADLVAATLLDSTQARNAFELDIIELPIGRDAVSLRLSTSRRRGHLSVLYRLRERADWLVAAHATATLPTGTAELPSTGVGAWQDRSALDARFARHEIDALPSSVQRVASSPDGRTITLELSDAQAEITPQYCLHPVAIAVALQTCTLLRREAAERARTDEQFRVLVLRPGVPIARIVVERDAGTGVHVHGLDFEGKRVAHIACGLEQHGSCDATEVELREVCDAALGTSYAASDNLLSMGVGSLGITRLLSAVHERWQVSVPFSHFIEDPSLTGLLCAIHDAQRSMLPEHAAQLDTIIAREPISSEHLQPLTAQQRAIWLASRKPGASLAYIESVAFRVTGPLDVTRLESALAKAAQRHESYRTCIVETDGLLQQRVLPVSTVKLARDRLPRSECAADVDGSIRAWLTALLSRAFDTGDVLLRACLLELDERDHVFVLLGHHAVCDGTTLRRRLLIDLSADYQDVNAATQQTALQPRHLARWEAQLAGSSELEQIVQACILEQARAANHAEPALAFGTGPRASHTGGRTYVELPPRIGRELRELSRRERCSVFVLLMSAFRAFLYRWTGAQSLSISTPLALSWSPVFEHGAGCYINVVPLLLTVDGARCVRDIVHATHRQVAAAIDRQHISHALVAERESASESVASEALQFGFAFDEAPLSLQLGQTVSRLIPVDCHYSKSELLLRIELADDSLSCCFEYSAELYSRSLIERLAERWQRLLVELGTQLTTPLRSLPWLSDAERQRILEFDRGAQLSGAIPVLQAFDRHVTYTPESLAIVAPSTQLTYTELDRHANALADVLHASGVAGQDLVGIYVENSWHFPLAVLSVWKAGAAFVAVDPNQPLARSELMLRDARVACVLTLRRHGPDLKHMEVRAIMLDEVQPSAQPSRPTPAPTELAYAIYTSGSTGTPKLALATHAGLANKLLAQRATFQLPLGTRVLHFASPAFDAAISEILLALSCGGVLVVVPAQTRHDGLALTSAIVQRRVQAAMLTPSVVSTLSAESAVELTTLLLIGERCPAELVQAWSCADGTTRRQIYNLYGPTETTVWATYDACNPDEALPPIGRPIPNVSTYIVDRDLNLAFIGQPGEICVGGAGVGPGYRNNSALTSERFLPDPYGTPPGARLYRTGDRGVQLDDGRFVFLGRNDEQVKLHGCRVELGEIEAALLAQPGVENAVVCLQHAGTSRATLCGFIQPKRGALVDTRRVRDALRLRLPSVMVPSRIELLETLPQLPSGKIDRTQLARRFRSSTDETREPPNSETECHVIAAVAHVLNLDPTTIDVEVDFSAHGGHSLHVVSLARELALRTGISVPIGALLRSPPLRELCSIIDASMASTPSHAEANLIRSDLRSVLELRALAMEPQTPRVVLLTGATGALGRQLLAALLRRTHAQIHCLVRAATPADAHVRVAQVLHEVAPNVDDAPSRVRALVGRLDAPSLGLHEAVYTELCDEIDTIVHVAADVNFALPYSALRQINVEGTRGLLNLCARGRAKQFHYVSSLSALFPRRDAVATVLAEVAPPDPELLAMGYSQTKAVSEQLLLQAASSGATVRIYRPSRILPSFTSGTKPATDLLVSFVRTCLRVGRFPDTQAVDNLIPAEVVANTIVDLTLCPKLQDRVFHIANPTSTPILSFARALSALGHSLSLVRPDRWSDATDREAAGLHELFRITRVFDAGLPKIEMRNAQPVLTSQACPTIDTQWLVDNIPSWL